MIKTLAPVEVVVVLALPVTLSDKLLVPVGKPVTGSLIGLVSLLLAIPVPFDVFVAITSVMLLASPVVTLIF